MPARQASAARVRIGILVFIVVLNIGERERRKLLHYSALSSKDAKQRKTIDVDAENITEIK